MNTNRSYLKVFVSPAEEIFPSFVDSVYTMLSPIWRMSVQIDPHFRSMAATLHIVFDEVDGVDDALIFMGADKKSFIVTVHRHQPYSYNTRSFHEDDWEAAVRFIAGDEREPLELDWTQFEGLLE